MSERAQNLKLELNSGWVEVPGEGQAFRKSHRRGRTATWLDFSPRAFPFHLHTIGRPAVKTNHTRSSSFFPVLFLHSLRPEDAHTFIIRKSDAQFSSLTLPAWKGHFYQHRDSFFPFPLIWAQWPFMLSESTTWPSYTCPHYAPVTSQILIIFLVFDSVTPLSTCLYIPGEEKRQEKAVDVKYVWGLRYEYRRRHKATHMATFNSCHVCQVSVTHIQITQVMTPKWLLWKRSRRSAVYLMTF